MAQENLVEAIGQQDWLDAVGKTVQPAVAEAFDAAGPVGQEVKNFLHGTWLGHPLHPVLTDLPVGAWTTALAFDAVATLKGDDGFADAADKAIAVGLVGAVGAAVTGITDWSATSGHSQRMGTAHALFNVGATTLYATSLVLRKRKARGAGVAVSLLGYALASAGAYLGGHLVYGHRVGVDHTAHEEPPGEFVPVLAEADLEEGVLRRAEADGVPVLLFRRGEQIHAILETCSHMGGPLADGHPEGTSVRCPWHGSRFDLETGEVIDGPATFPQPCFDVRIRNGTVEVRAKGH